MLDPSVLMAAQSSVIPPIPPGVDYYAAAQVQQPWLYWRLNDSTTPGVDYGVAAPGPTNHTWSTNGGTLHSTGLLTPANPSTNGGNYCIAGANGDNSRAYALGGLGHGATDFSIEYLFQFQTAGSHSQNTHFSIQRTGVGGSNYWLENGFLGTNLDFPAQLAGVGTVILTWTGTSHILDDGAVHQITLTFALGSGAGYDVILYVDAVSFGSQHGDNMQQIQFDNVAVGQLSGPNAIAGNTQEFRIYQSVLSPSAVSNHWSNR
jgi:hypothetical protein